MLTVISYKLAKLNQTYDSSSVQFEFPKDVASEVIAWGKQNVPENVVYKEDDKYGRENEIHTTVKYGLHTTSKSVIENILKTVEPFDIELGAITKFSREDKPYDVLKIDVEGEKLHNLNKKLNELPNSDEHPEYEPHVTISYIKKGTCEELMKKKPFAGRQFRVSKVTFSVKDDGGKFELKLGK